MTLKPPENMKIVKSSQYEDTPLLPKKGRIHRLPTSLRYLTMYADK